jgi:putative transposase
MPNHVHGIIVINAHEICDSVVETQHAASLHNPSPNPSSMSASLHNDQNHPQKQTKQKSLPEPGSISAIVRSYKSAVTRWAGQNGYLEFKWQVRFFDRIIRDESSLVIVRAYIIENPCTWELDEYYSPLIV